MRYSQKYNRNAHLEETVYFDNEPTTTWRCSTKFWNYGKKSRLYFTWFLIRTNKTKISNSENCLFFIILSAVWWKRQFLIVHINYCRNSPLFVNIYKNENQLKKFRNLFPFPTTQFSETMTKTKVVKFQKFHIYGQDITYILYV